MVANNVGGCVLVAAATADTGALIPVVDRLRKCFSVRRVCIVADRGMISAETIAELETRGAAVGRREIAVGHEYEEMAADFFDDCLEFGNGRCDHAPSITRSPTAFAANGVPRSTPDPSSKRPQTIDPRNRRRPSRPRRTTDPMRRLTDVRAGE